MIADDLERLGATRLLVDLLGHAASTAERPAPALNAEDSAELVTLCSTNRLAPILGDAVADGRIGIADSELPNLVAVIEKDLAGQLLVEAEGMPVVDALLESGIDVRITKGMATSYLDYPNPAMRPLGDLDLLVPLSEMPDAIAALASLPGGEFHVQPGNDWRITHALPFRMNGVEIDLHNRLLHQAAGHCAARLDLFADAEHYEIAGRSVAALPAWLRLIHAASQNVLGGFPQTSSDLDVARLSRHCDEAVGKAAGVGLGWVVAEGIRRSQKNLGWGPGATDGSQATARHWTLRDRMFQRLYADQPRSVLERSAFELAMAQPTVAARIVWRTLRPGEAYLEQRGRSTSEQIARQLKRLRRPQA